MDAKDDLDMYLKETTQNSRRKAIVCIWSPRFFSLTS